MHPTQVIDLLADFKAKTTVPDFMDYAQALLTSQLDWNYKSDGKKIRWQDEQLRDESVWSLVRRMGTAPSNALSYFVKADMVDVVSAAANALDGTDHFDLTMVPSNSGFIVLEKPLEIQDIRGTKMLVHTILFDKGVANSYSSANDGRVHRDLAPTPVLCVYQFNDGYRQPDEITENIINNPDLKGYIESFGRWHLQQCEIIMDEMRVGPKEVMVSEDYMKHMQYAFSAKPFDNIIRWIWAYFLMLNQTIVRLDDEVGDRRQRKMARRMNIPDRVTVIDLRRIERPYHADGEANVEWQHQWIVRGHWRWQPYKGEDGMTHHKRIWINPYIKGPDDKPLLVTDKVLNLRR